MNRLEDHLRKLSKPDLELPLNQRAVRKFMLKRCVSQSNLTFNNLLFNMSIYKILPAGLALILIIVVGANFLSNNEEIIPPVSAAEEIVNSSLQKVENLNPEELEQIKQKMNLQEDSEVISILKNAKSASDLKIIEPTKISCTEVESIKEAQFNLPGIKVGGSINSDSSVKVNLPGIDFSTSENGMNLDMPGMNVSIPEDQKEVSKAEVSNKTEYNNFFLFDDEKGCKNPMRWDFEGDNPNELVLIDVNNSESVTYLEYTQNGTRMILGFNQELLPLNAVELSSDGMTQTFINGVTLEDSENSDSDEDSDDEDLEDDFDSDDEESNENEAGSNVIDESSDLSVDASGIDVNISDEDQDGNGDVNVEMPGIGVDINDDDNQVGDDADVKVNMPGIDFSTSGDNVDVKMPGIDFSTGGF